MTNSCQVVADSAHQSTVDFINNTFFGLAVQSNIPQKSTRPFLQPIVNFLRDEKLYLILALNFLFKDLYLTSINRVPKSPPLKKSLSGFN